jgi:hypothetical protein
MFKQNNFSKKANYRTYLFNILQLNYLDGI